VLCCAVGDALATDDRDAVVCCAMMCCAVSTDDRVAVFNCALGTDDRDAVLFFVLLCSAVVLRAVGIVDMDKLLVMRWARMTVMLCCAVL
jgi:hypothetical protein